MAKRSIYDLTINAGDDHEFVLSWSPEGDTPDLADASATMLVSWADGLLLTGEVVAAGTVEFTSAAFEIEFDTDEATVTVHMPDTKTALIPELDPVYQLRVTTADGAKTTIARGRLSALRNVIDE